VAEEPAGPDVTGVPGTVLLAGITGSRAYGLDHPGSDTDRLGVFAAPTASLVAITRPLASGETVRPGSDAQYHEARKYLYLALRCNPAATELVWLPDRLIEVRTPAGDDLIAIRDTFLSATQVASSYLDYARAQYRCMKGSTGHPRTAKHARHLARVLVQGQQLHRDGHLILQLADPQWFHDFGNQVAAGDLGRCETLIAAAEETFRGPSPLPAGPDPGPAEAWLYRVRRGHWE
jgi:uncharacterized protein